MPIDVRFSSRTKVKRIHHLFQQGVILLAFPNEPRDTPPALPLRFMTSPQHLGAQLVLLFLLLRWREGAIVNRYQAVILRSIDHEDLIGFDGGRRVPLTLYIVFDERVLGRFLPVGFDLLDAAADNLGRVRLRASGRCAADRDTEYKERSH